MRVRAILMLSAVVCLVGYGTAQATPITYTLSVIGSGQLGADTFTNAAITITTTADTSTIITYNPITLQPLTGVYNIPDITATVTIEGLGTASFTDTMYNVANHGATGLPSHTPTPTVGFSDFNQNKSILFDFSEDLATYDLSTALGPISGQPVSGNPSTSFPTDEGGFRLDSFSGSTSQVTFVATVPEPSSFALIGIACGALMTGRRWRRPATVIV